VGPYVMQAPPKCVPYPPVYGYMYTSGPKAVGIPDRQYKSSRPKPKPDGGYYNTMFDPRVYRGTTLQDFKDAERERCTKSEKQSQKREVMKKRKAMQARQYKLGGIVRPKTPPLKSRDINKEATELFLIEHIRKIEEMSIQIQTEVELAPLPIPENLKLNSGINAGTQILDWDLFDFEEEIGVIAPVLAEKVLEQAVIEAMEEEEQLFLRGVWATAHQKLHVAQSHLEILKDQEKEFAAKVEARRLELFQEERDSQELEENIGCIFFAQSYISQMNRNLTKLLHKEGTLYDISYDAIKEYLQPWLSKEVRKEVIRMKIASSVLDDIIITNVKQRAAAVLGDLGLEIDFRGSIDSATEILCQRRDLVISDSNPSTDYGEEMDDSSNISISDEEGDF